MNENGQNSITDINISNNNAKQELINLILTSSENAGKPEHQDSLYKLYQEERDEVKITSNLLEILDEFDQCINKLSQTQNLQLLIFIKNILERFKAKPKLKQIQNFEKKVYLGIIFYLNFNFSNTNANSTDYNQLKNIYDVIINFLFDLIVVMQDPKNFLQQIYDKIILNYLNNKNNLNNIISHESVIKFIFVYESFCRIYLIYINKNEEINIIFDKYYELLKYCKLYCASMGNISHSKSEKEKKELDDLNAKLINQCILSFSKTTMLCLDQYIKCQILFISPEFKKSIDEKSNERYIFMNNDYFLKFMDSCFYYDDNKNIFSLGIEYANNPQKRFDFILTKGKGILIEVLTVLIKKLTKYELFNSYENFNTFSTNYYCNIVDYLIDFYKAGNYPREKANNEPEEIIQLSVIVKAINFIDEIIDNQIYQKLIDSNLFKINCNNKNEKYENIFKYIIVPNLLQTELEKTFFEFDQDEYLKNLLDMCNKCEVKLPKQKSIKLLITICDVVDGFLSYVTHIYILILKNISLTNNNTNNTVNIQIEEKYKPVYSFLTQNINPFNLIEQSLQVLTSISFLFGDKPEVGDFFNEEIDLINYMLIKITDPFLKSKLCAFYSLNLDTLFHNDEEVLSKSFDDSLNFLFDCIFNKTSNPSLIKTALNCINEVIFNNYIKKFCVTSVCIYALKVINFFNIKENLAGNEEEFNEFLKGIVKEYMYDLGDSTIQLFSLFWDKFFISLNKISKEGKDTEDFGKRCGINTINSSGILKDKTKEVNEAMELSSQINIIKNFINIILNKEIDIKNNIYEKILSLFPKLSSYLDIDFEEEILQLISKVITDVKLLPESYFLYFKNYFNSLNKSLNNEHEYEYRLEKYHLDFIFTCLQSFKKNLLENEKIKEILINNMKTRLSTVRRCIPINKIFSEHYVYCDMGLCIDIFFFDNFTNANICELIEIFYQRMEKIPNTDFNLNTKLCIDIFLLLIKSDNYDIFDKVFLNNKKVNLYNFLCKVISFFPVKDLSLIEHQVIAIFCSLIIRYMIIKQKNNQKILINDDKYLKDIDTQKIFYHIFNLNLNQLNIIKTKSTYMMNKNQIKEEELIRKNQNKEIIFDTYPINDTNDSNNFKKNTKMVYNERKPHSESIIKKYDYSNNENSIDYKATEDDFLINDDKFDNKDDNDKYDEKEEYDDENMDPLKYDDDDENENGDNDNNEDENSNCDDDRDEEFLTIKNECKNNFSYYFNKFANEELVVYLRQINEFHLFEIMIKDIEVNDANFLNLLLNQIKTSQGENKLKLIQQFKGIQKIEFKSRNLFSYRKIIKIQNNKK